MHSKQSTPTNAFLSAMLKVGLNSIQIEHIFRHILEDEDGDEEEEINYN